MIVSFILSESLRFYSSCERLSNDMVCDAVFSDMCKALLIVCDTVGNAF